MSKMESLAHASPFEVYPSVKPWPRFACGFHFRHSPRLPFAAVLSVLKGLILVPVGTMGPCSPKDNPFKTVKGLVDYV